MKKKYYWITGIIVLIISGCVQQSNEISQIPSNMTYFGYSFFNCELNTEYPLIVDKSISTISGKAIEETGSGMAPYSILKIDEKYLFDAKTKKPVEITQQLKDKQLIVKGYLDKGDITGEKWWEENHTTFVIKIVDAIYVTEIISWGNVCCNICCNTESLYYNKLKQCFWYKQ